jgi:glucokinase
LAAPNNNASRLVGDIGGTNTRLALYDPDENELRELRTYVNREHAQLEEILADWLARLSGPPPRICCLAVAAPPFDDRITMLNIDWSFSVRQLAERFGFSQLRCINDFEGNAHALPHLGDDQLLTLHPGKITRERTLAVIGPGTGLGGATLHRGDGVPTARASEPGHMGLAMATELELELLKLLQPRYGELYAELLVSGPGLQRLHQSLAIIRGQDTPELTPEDISSRALAGQSELCSQTMDTFCALLGSIAGDFVLANGAYGGLFLAGRIVSGIIPLLHASPFVERFQQKGNMREHLSEVPLYVVKGDSTGLLGAAHAPL